MALEGSKDRRLRRITERRSELGLSPRDLADKAGISHQTVYDAESGAKSPTLSTLAKIAKVLGVTVRELL
jgi:HTH-type transcriptional repressor of puuD